VTSLTVRYDARCGLCCAVAAWVAQQPKLLPVACAPGGLATSELKVIADTGECWSGDDAWVMVLWALTRHRHTAYRLASPVVRPTAKALFKVLSAYRGSISCALHLPAEA
jgi:predicted DCC family thiol-disulfide oxidoreductase YuxK